jgi:hypothetical protein
MAEVRSSRSTPLPNYINRYDVEEENECIFCYKLKEELHFIHQELSSAKKNYSDITRRKEVYTQPRCSKYGNRQFQSRPKL